MSNVISMKKWRRNETGCGLGRGRMWYFGTGVIRTAGEDTMSDLVIVKLWGPETGCELDISAQPEEIYVMVSERVRDHLRSSMPEAVVVWVALAEEARMEDGALVPGYALEVTIRVGGRVDPQDNEGEDWLSGWLESHVSVALLELINPMTIDQVNVTRPDEELE